MPTASTYVCSVFMVVTASMTGLVTWKHPVRSGSDIHAEIVTYPEEGTGVEACKLLGVGTARFPSVDACKFASDGSAQANESLTAFVWVSINDAVTKLRLNADLLADVPLAAWAVILPLCILVEMYTCRFVYLMLKCCCRRARSGNASMVKVGSGLAADHDSQSSQDCQQTIIFRPGRVGIDADWVTGRVHTVFSGEQAEQAGVAIGWRMVQVAGAAYTEDSLDEKIAGSAPYNIMFSCQDDAIKGEGNGSTEDASTCADRESEEAAITAQESGSESDASAAAVRHRYCNRGTVKTIIRVGDGNTHTRPGDFVKINYVGWLSNGTQWVIEEGYRTQLGAGHANLIRGLADCIPQMIVGEKSKIEVPADRAFGSTGCADKVPPNEDLIFEVELLAIEKQ